MKLIKKILDFMDRTDGYFLKLFQKWSDSIQINIGIPCTGMARIILLLYFICSVLIAVVLGSEHGWKKLAVTSAILLWYYWRLEIGIKRNEESSSNRIFMNDNAYEYAYLRQTLIFVLFVFLPALPLLIPFIAPFFGPIERLLDDGPLDLSKPDKRFLHGTLIFFSYLRYYLLLVCLYFLSCTPRPPGESRLAKYVRSKIGLKTHNN
jgi:hypothetical protein